MANIIAVQNLFEALQSQDCMSESEIKMCQQRLDNLRDSKVQEFEVPIICAAVFSGCKSDTQMAIQNMLVGSKHNKPKEGVHGY